MKKILKIATLSLLFALPVISFLGGCGGSSRENLGKKTPTEQPDSLRDYKVKFLFEVDGVRVYRFEDYGLQIYFTNANGRTEYKTSHYNPATKCSTTRYHQCTCTDNDNQTCEDEEGNAGQKD